MPWLHTTCLEARFEGNSFFEKLVFSFFSDSGKNLFALLLHFFHHGFYKSFLHVRRDNLTEKGFSKKTNIFFPFRTLNNKISGFCRKLFGRVVKCILRVQKNILTKNDFVKKEDFFIFRKSAENFRALAGKKAGLSKMQSSCPKNNLRKTGWMRYL